MTVYDLNEIVSVRRAQLQQEKGMQELEKAMQEHEEAPTERATCAAYQCTQPQTRAFRDSDYCDEHTKAIKFRFEQPAPKTRQAWRAERQRGTA